MRHRAQGMTLLELVIVCAIIGILASVAVPSYRSHVLRANRAEGRGTLLALAAAQEKFYLQCNTYASTLDPTAATDCDAGLLRFSTRSERGHYDIAVIAADANGWTATAVPAAASPQIDDARCQWYGLTSTGARTARTSTGAPNNGDCWGK